MPVTDIHIAGYRSIRSIRFPVRQLSVLVGGNGVGKTNLYRSLQLLQAAALGTLSEEIARDGGLGSISWAGERKSHEPARLVLEVRLEIDEVGADTGYAPTYALELGFPPPKPVAAFPLEAQIKSETLTVAQAGRNVVLMERKGQTVWVRDGKGKRQQVVDGLLDSETALSGLRGGYPEIDAVRHALASWRFYHGFRTDADAPLRRPGFATTTPMLAADGSNLAAVFATLRHIREETIDLDAAIEDAFPGAELLVPLPMETAEFALRFPDLPKRQFPARELSDGQLQFLALMGALLSYRLPPFIALNEPETSLHPDLLPPLARIIAKAAERTQVWVVTHSQVLADALADTTGILPRTVIRQDGATWIEGLNKLGQFADE